MLSNKYKDCLDYIECYWDKIIHKPDKEKVIDQHVITIPHPHIVPNDKKFRFIFYWDTSFMFRGLMGTNREWILKDMVDNFAWLYDKYGIIPNFNAPASMGRSQPPFFTSMILDTYNGYFFPYLRMFKEESPAKRDLAAPEKKYNIAEHKEWLRYVTEVAKKEYGKIWMDSEGLYHHDVKGYILNRYGDMDLGYAHSSELESGWDFTSRFYNRCNDFLPIDLNVFLFKYERDFAKIASHLADREEEGKWKKKAEERKEEINRLMWNEKEGFFYDYGYHFKRQSDFLSLAGFTPLWAGLANSDQAEKMVKKLTVFETQYGLTITAKESLARPLDLSKIQKRYHPAILEITQPKQWDYPNSWPPLEYLTVIGLLKYGFVEDAKRLMEKYLTAWAGIFRKHGTFFEKMNAVTGDKMESFHYPNQEGFGWTNAIFYRYVQILTDINERKEIYQQPKSENPPYILSIIH